MEDTPCDTYSMPIFSHLVIVEIVADAVGSVRQVSGAVGILKGSFVDTISGRIDTRRVSPIIIVCVVIGVFDPCALTTVPPIEAASLIHVTTLDKGTRP